jgi:hypothetical protein
MALINSLRLRAGENFLETRIASQRIPFPAQTKVGERNVIRKIRPLDGAGRGKETLDERDRLILFAYECIYQRQIACPNSAVKCVMAFWLELEPAGQNIKQFSETFQPALILMERLL